MSDAEKKHENGGTVFYNGLRRYFSEEQLAKLAKVTVGVAGAGGLGSNVAMLLARSGIRHFVLVDHDVVDASNLNRQFFWPADIGKPKAYALSEKLYALADPEGNGGFGPGVPPFTCHISTEGLTPASIARVFTKCEIVVEALDDAALKASLCASLAAGGTLVVAASGIGGLGAIGGPPMSARRIGTSIVCVGDFVTDVADAPPYAPRVAQAAAMQAEAVLTYILR